MSATGHNRQGSGRAIFFCSCLDSGHEGIGFALLSRAEADIAAPPTRAPRRSGERPAPGRAGSHRQGLTLMVSRVLNSHRYETSGWRSNPYPTARRWMTDTVLDAALLAVACLPSLAVEALLHLLRKDDTVRWHALTCSVSSAESQNGLPDFGFMSVPGPERVVSHRLCQDRRYVGLQTISLLNIEPQNHGVVL